MAKKTPPPADEVVPRLYLMSPPLSDAYAFIGDLEAAMDAGDVACVLVDLAARDEGEAKKLLRVLLPLVQGRDAALLVPDDWRLAAHTGADGVHVRGQGEDLKSRIAEAVERSRPDRAVGAGGFRSRDDAMAAGELDVDYVMFGEPSADGWTPPPEQICERAAWWAEIFNVPCVAYAADLADVDALIAARVDFIALREAVWDDPRGPAAAVQDVMIRIASLGNAA